VELSECKKDRRNTYRILVYKCEGNKCLAIFRADVEDDTKINREIMIGRHGLE
jgi:hypothetical protein